MTTLTLRLHGLQAEIVERMVEAGLAETRSEAVRIALLQFGQSSGLIDEAALFKGLQRAAAEKPLSDDDILKGIGGSKRARLPRR
jgi:Arc/MetJ-type ribon-helix-helix transcriptional regulator